MISVVNSTMIATASIGSHSRIEAKSAIDTLVDYRQNLLKIAFPYFDFSGNARKIDNYDEYFDELERIIAENGGESQGTKEDGSPLDGEGLNGIID